MCNLQVFFRPKKIREGLKNKKIIKIQILGNFMKLCWIYQILQMHPQFNVCITIDKND